MGQPVVSVVMPARDSAETIARALTALELQDFPGEFELIVVDDGSTDDTVTIAEAFRGRLDLEVVRQERGGPAAARNTGVARSSASVIAFIDSDCFPISSWLRTGTEALKQQGLDVLQGRVAPDPSAPVGPWDRTLWVERETGLWETANLFLRRDYFDLVGGFEVWLRPKVGKPLAEDVWFGWRLKRAGARSGFSSQAVVHHAVFKRSFWGFLGERRRLQYFPAMARKMPELRLTFLFRRIFLSERTASFDLAIAGLLVGAKRSRWPALIATAPYLGRLLRGARHADHPSLAALPVYLVADGLSLLYLLKGSISHKSLVL